MMPTSRWLFSLGCLLDRPNPASTDGKPPCVRTAPAQATSAVDTSRCPLVVLPTSGVHMPKSGNFHPYTPAPPPKFGISLIEPSIDPNAGVVPAPADDDSIDDSFDDQIHSR